MCLLEAGGVRSLSLSVEGRENTEGVGEQGCEVRSDSTAEHLHTLSLCVSLLLTLKGVSLGIQSICPHEDALFLSPLCFTHYALYKVFIGLCQTSSAFLRGKKCQHMKRKTLHILLVVFVCVCVWDGNDSEQHYLATAYSCPPLFDECACSISHLLRHAITAPL